MGYEAHTAAKQIAEGGGATSMLGFSGTTDTVSIPIGRRYYGLLTALGTSVESVVEFYMPHDGIILNLYTKATNAMVTGAAHIVVRLNGEDTNLIVTYLPASGEVQSSPTQIAFQQGDFMTFSAYLEGGSTGNIIVESISAELRAI